MVLLGQDTWFHWIAKFHFEITQSILKERMSSLEVRKTPFSCLKFKGVFLKTRTTTTTKIDAKSIEENEAQAKYI